MSIKKVENKNNVGAFKYLLTQVNLLV